MTRKLYAGLVMLALLFSVIGVAAAKNFNANLPPPTGAPLVSSTPCPTPAATPMSTPSSGAPAPNRMAARIAARYCVTVAEVLAWHAQGLGYGGIGRAYALAAASGVSVDALLARHQAGEGWSPIARSLGYKVMGGGVNVRVVPLPQAGNRGGNGNGGRRP